MPDVSRKWFSLLGAVALLACCAVVISACGGSSSSSSSGSTESTESSEASSGSEETAESSEEGSATTAEAGSCGGTPIKIESMANITSPVSVQSPEYFAGLKAAAAAVTKECTAGAPVEIITCDDGYDPNKNAKCAREAVSDKVSAVISYGGLGDTYGPIVTKAGIPIMPTTATSATENSSPLSFPAGYPITSLLQSIQTGAALGAKKVTMVSFALPAAEFFVTAAKEQAKAFGMEVIEVVKVPLTATDMTSYAAQAKASGAEAIIPILGQLQLIPLLKNMNEIGMNFKETLLLTSLISLLPSGVQELGSAAEGIIANSWVVSPTETENASVKQYLAELEEAGEPNGPEDVTMIGMTGWAQVHMLAEALKEEKLEGTAANVKKALETADIPKISAAFGLSPINYQKPAFPGPLSKLRLFSSEMTLWEFNGEATPEPLLEGEQINTLEKAPKIERTVTGG